MKEPSNMCGSYENLYLNLILSQWVYLIQRLILDFFALVHGEVGNDFMG